MQLRDYTFRADCTQTQSNMADVIRGTHIHLFVRFCVGVTHEPREIEHSAQKYTIILPNKGEKKIDRKNPSFSFGQFYFNAR